MIRTTGKRLIRLLERDFGCQVIRQKGSHVLVRCGDCQATVALHSGETIPVGTLKRIERDLAPCLGTGWLRGR